MTRLALACLLFTVAAARADDDDPLRLRAQRDRYMAPNARQEHDAKLAAELGRARRAVVAAAGRKRGLAACRPRRADARRAVVLRLAFDGDGAVAEVGFVGDGTGEPRADACLLAAFREWRAAKAHDQTVELPIRFGGAPSPDQLVIR